MFFFFFVKRLFEDFDENIKTNCYRKKTRPGQYLNYNSHHYFKQKQDLKGLIDRAIKLSDLNNREENIDLVKNTLLSNIYPLPLIDTIIKERINYIYNSSYKKTKNFVPDKLNSNITLPYVKTFSEKLETSLKRFNIYLYAYFTIIPNKLKDFFTNKKKIRKIKKTYLVRHTK